MYFCLCKLVYLEVSYVPFRDSWILSRENRVKSQDRIGQNLKKWVMESLKTDLGVTNLERFKRDIYKVLKM